MRVEESRIKEVMFDEFIEFLSKYAKAEGGSELNYVFFILLSYVEEVGERIVTLVDFKNRFSRIYAYVDEPDMVSYLRDKVSKSTKMPFKIVLNLEKINNEVIPKIVYVKEVPNIDDIKGYENFLSLAKRIKLSE